MKPISQARRQTRMQMLPDNIQAIQAGRKTSTRRLCNLDGIDTMDLSDAAVYAAALAKCPYGQIGDQLCFTESFAQVNLPGTEGYALVYRADTPDDTDTKWSPARFMPKEKARYWGLITSLRLERVQAISLEGAKSEGIECKPVKGPYCYRDYLNDGFTLTAQASFATLWESLHGPGAWNANDVVWVIGFLFIPIPK